MNIKRIIFGGMAIVLFLGGFITNNTFAQSTNPLCSTTLRNELARTDQDTYKILYNITDPLLIKYIDKNYANFNLNKTISGEPLWYDNKKGGCNNLGTFVLGSYNLEKDNWNNFRNKYGSVAGIINGNELSQSTVTNMQNYIKDYCGFNMGIDGQLGKKTINSINICKPPASGKLLRNDFKTLTETKTSLFVDNQGKTPIYNGTTFDINFKPDDIYIDLNDITAKSKGITDQSSAITRGLKIVNKNNTTSLCSISFGILTIPSDAKEEGGKCCYAGNNVEGGPNLNTSWSVQGISATYIPPVQTTNFVTPVPGSITIPVCGKSIDSNVATCRFKPQSGITPSTEYTIAANNQTDYKIPTDCSKGCDGGYTEIKKGGISICEKCDIEKCNCGIKLNTNIPFIGRCIMNEKTNNVGQSGNVTTVNTLNAFPILMGALIKLLMSIIMIVCFASLIVGGFMMTVPDQYDTGKGIVKKVIRTIVALGSLGTILYLINPNFFS